VNRRTALQTLITASAGSFFPRSIGAHPQEEEPILRSEVRLVLLDVCVKDSKGGFATGLTKDNFSVLENGKPQPITVFDHDDSPVTVGILVDESRSMTPKRSQVLTGAETLIEESNRLDQIFVLNFNERVMPGLTREHLFSDDIPQLRAALQRGLPEGRTAVYDAVVTGLKHLELGTRDKKTLVLISDGGDNASSHSRRETMDMVQRSIATIYAVGLFDIDAPDRDPGLLRQLAKVSGGEAYFPENPEQMAPVCRRIAQEIRSRYTVGFHPQEDNGSQRHLHVRVSAPGHGRLTAHTRSSYFYDAPESHKK
jgi:VWFA-related protein